MLEIRLLLLLLLVYPLYTRGYTSYGSDLGTEQKRDNEYKELKSMVSELTNIVRAQGVIIQNQEENIKDLLKNLARQEKKLDDSLDILQEVQEYIGHLQPHFSILPKSVRVKSGGYVNLTCAAVGSPMPNVKWHFNGTELKDNNVNSIGRNVYTLSNIRESANYTCVASSLIGSIEAVAEVKLKVFPEQPSNVVISDVTATSVKLAWNAGTLNTTEYYVIQYSYEFAFGWPEVNANITKTEYNVTGLDAYMNYNFRVLGVNKDGRSQPSSVVHARTREMPPGSPPRHVCAKPVNSSTVKINWREPEEANGVIKGYIVYITRDKSGPISTWKTHKVNNSIATTISNLLTDRTYTISVSAFNSHGNGPMSAPIQVQRKEGAILLGSTVRVKPSVEFPRFGWSGVTRDSVGTVIDFGGYCDRMWVDFPERLGWHGLVSEMEVVPTIN